MVLARPSEDDTSSISLIIHSLSAGPPRRFLSRPASTWNTFTSSFCCRFSLLSPSLHISLSHLLIISQFQQISYRYGKVKDTVHQHWLVSEWKKISKIKILCWNSADLAVSTSCLQRTKKVRWSVVVLRTVLGLHSKTEGSGCGGEQQKFFGSVRETLCSRRSCSHRPGWRDLFHLSGTFSFISACLARSSSSVVQTESSSSCV